MLVKLLLLASAGALGTLARFGLIALGSLAVPTLPIGTWLVNVLGSAAFGVVYALSLGSARISDDARIVICTGFLGAFTTFSGFAHDFTQLWTRGQHTAACLYLLGTNAASIAALAAGMKLAAHLTAKA